MHLKGSTDIALIAVLCDQTPFTYLLSSSTHTTNNEIGITIPSKYSKLIGCIEHERSYFPTTRHFSADTGEGSDAMCSKILNSPSPSVSAPDKKNWI